MPIRGENVGTAYVKILADGRDLKKSIKDDLDNTDGVFHDKGDEHAGIYDKATRKRIEKDRPGLQREVKKVFQLHSDEARALAKEMSSTYFKNLEKQIIKQNGRDIGGIIVRDIRKDFLKQGGWGAILDSEGKRTGESKFLNGILDSLPARVEKATAKINRDYDKMYEEAIRMNHKFDTENTRSITNRLRQEELLAKAQAKAIRENDARFKHAANDIIASMHRIERGQRTDGNSIRSDLKKTLAGFRDLNREIKRNPSLGGKDRNEIIRTLTALERGLRRTHPLLRGLSGDLDNSAQKIGRLFGKGSRNNFLNFTGSAVGGLVSLGARVPRLVEKLLNIPTALFDVVRTFNTLREEGFTTFQALGKSFASGAAGVGGLLAKIVPLAAAILILIPVIGTLVSLASLLLGVLVALASTISFALVGALGVALGLLGPLAAAAGVLGLAFLGLGNRTSKTHKQLLAFLEPITARIKALSQVTKEHLFAGLTKDGANFGKGLGSLKPLVIGVADALSAMFGAVAKAAAGTGFKTFIGQITPLIVKMLPELGIAVGNTAKGIAGLFRAVLPSADSFLVTLDKLTAKFAEWANKASGQNAIKRFMDDAKTSAQSLGHFIGQLSGLLGDLLFNSQGKKTGDSLFNSMADALKRFRTFIADGGIQQWFKDAKKFGEAFGGTIVSIGKALKELDDSATRDTVVSLFRTLNDIIENTARGIHRINHAFGVVGEGIKNFFRAIAKSFVDMEINIDRGIGAILKAASFTAGALAKITPGKNDFGKSKIDAMRDSLQGSIDKLKETSQGLSNTGKEKIKPKVDFSDLKKLKGVADTTDKALRLLLGLPPIKPKVDKKPVLDALTPTEALLGQMHGLGALAAIQLKFNKVQADRAALAVEQTKQKMLKLAGLPTSHLKIDALKAKLAKDLVDALRTSVDRLHNKEIVVTTRFHQIGTGPKNGSLIATGGIVDRFGLHRVKKMAGGGLANFAQKYEIGESGREAIVPLDRPLGQVDPAVRLLSAFAQGKLGDVTHSASKTVDASGWIIQTPTKNPAAVAQEVLDALVAKIL